MNNTLLIAYVENLVFAGILLSRWAIPHVGGGYGYQKGGGTAIKRGVRISAPYIYICM